MRLKLLVLISTALLLGGSPATAAPGEDIGAAVKIVNLVTAEYETDQRRLAQGDNVRQDELIEVGTDGTGEIRLRDNTQLALGPGSRLLLDEFVYKPDISGGAIVLNLVRGSFRFITGIAAKPAYVIRTPSAAITVRGTIFDVYVQTSGMSWLLLIEGAIEVCNERGDCGLHDEPGKLIRITPDGDLGNPVKWASLQKDGQPFEAAFPFVVAPPSFESDPVFTPEDIVGGDVPDVRDGSNGDTDEANAGTDTTPPTTPPSTPPPTSPPLHCWVGWKQVPQGWIEKGWRVKQRRRGDRVIYCAHPVAPPAGPDTPIEAGVHRRQSRVAENAAAALELRVPERRDTPPDRQECLRLCRLSGRLAVRSEKGLSEEGLEMDAQGLRRSERPVPEGLHRQPAELPEAATAAVPEGLCWHAAQLPEAAA